MPRPKEFVIDNNYPFIKINEEYVFEKTNDLKIKVSYTATGESATVRVSTESVNYNYWAHSDYNIETLTDNYKSHIAIWLDESNVWYPESNQNVTFENLRCGATYKLHIGYMLSDGTYITDAIYIQTWKFSIILKEIHSRYIICELSSNYPGKYEWWSDQDSSRRVTEDGLTKINISEYIHHRNFMTIYGQILDMDNTRDVEEKIYIPLIYENSIIDISGTTVIVKPNINTDYTNEEISWAVSIEEENIYNEYYLSTEIAYIRNLKNNSHYNLKVLIKYTSPEEGTESDYIDTYEYQITTYGTHIIEELDKKINSFKLQLAETVADCYNPIEDFDINHFSHKNYKAFVVKNDNDDYDTSNHVGEVNINQDDETVEITKLERNTDYRIYIYLDEIKNFVNRNYDTFIYYDIKTLDTVRCNEFECNVTAQSCTISPKIETWNGSNELKIKAIFYCKEINDTQSISTTISRDDIHDFIINTLKSGYRYTITFEAYDDYDNKISINSLEITTYGLHVEFEDNWIHTRYVDKIRFNFIEGMKSSTIKQRAGLSSSCRWWISSDPDDSESIIFGPYDISLSLENPLEIVIGKKDTIFLPNRTYYIYTMIDGIRLDGLNDSVICYPFKTKNCINDINYNTSISGTTISVSFDWVEPTIESYEYSINVKLYDNSDDTMLADVSINSLQDILFTKLINGKNYRLAITAYDSENNTSSDYININGGNIFDLTTYKLLFTNIESTTRSVKWVTQSNLPLPEDSKIESIIQYNDNNFNDSWESNNTISINKQTTLDKITHDTTVDIALRVNNILDENGNPDVISYSKGIRTRKLSVSIIDATFDADNAILNYEMYSNSSKIPLPSGNNRALKDKSYAWEYENDDSEKIIATNADNSTVKFSNLKLDTTYNFIIAATDGYNIVFSDSYINNTVPHVIYIYNRNKQQYDKVIPYVFHNGRFVKTSIYIYHNNKWHETY